MSTQHHADSIGTVTAKLAPPASVSIATFMGYQVSELLIWATLIYTLLMIGHKAYVFCRDVCQDLKE